MSTKTPRSLRTTIGANRQQHTRYRQLLARTGLHQPVFIDRLLDLAEKHIDQLVAVDSGIRAAS